MKIGAFANPDQKETYDIAFFEILEDVNPEYLTIQHKAREWIHDTACRYAKDKKVFLFPDVAAFFLLMLL